VGLFAGAELLGSRLLDVKTGSKFGHSAPGPSAAVPSWSGRAMAGPSTNLGVWQREISLLGVQNHAASTASGDLAIGNVIGANIANVLLILRPDSLVAPDWSPAQLNSSRTCPSMFGASLVRYALGWDEAGLSIAPRLTDRKSSTLCICSPVRRPIRSFWSSAVRSAEMEVGVDRG